MARRLVGGTLVATSVLIGQTGSFAAPELPRAGCVKSVLDPAEDAVIDHIGTGSGTPGTSNVKGLDLRGVTLRLTPEHLEVYVRLEQLPASLENTESAHMYEVTLKSDPKSFRVQHVIVNTAHDKSLRPDNTQTYPRAHAGTGTTFNVPLEGTAAEIDRPSGHVILRVPRAPIEKALDAPLKDGSLFTDITAKTTQYVASRPFAADKTTVTGEEATYAAGDDYCFGPPPAALTDFAASAVQYGDATTLSATLISEAGEKLEGKPVQFTVAGEAPLTGTTDAEGVATVTYTPVNATAGSPAVTVSFAGEPEIGKATLADTVLVKAEVTKFSPLTATSPSSKTRTVTATLLDDDKRAVAAQKVDWYVNGKKVATVVTDSKGRSVYKGAKPGQSVQAKFAGVSGKYAAAASAAKKV